MSDNSQVLVVSDDHALFEDISANSPQNSDVVQLKLGGRVTSEASAVDLIEAIVNSDKLAVLALDLAGIPRTLQQATIQQIKAFWPHMSLIVMGDADDITHALETHVQPLIYRAFKHPVSVKQLALSLEPALGFFRKAEDLLNAPPLVDRRPAAQSESKKSVVLVGFGLAALCGVAWYFLSSPPASDSADFEVAVNPPSTINTELNVDDAGTGIVIDTIPDNDADQGNDIDLTIDLGELALLDGRLIAPKLDSAEYYFDLALRQDPYNPRAYSANQKLAQALLLVYPGLIADGRYIQAFAHLDAYKRIAPLDSTLAKMYKDAGLRVSEHFKTLRDSKNTSAFQQARTEYQALSTRLDDEATIASILKNETQTQQAIDAALRKGNLVPPTQGNAYNLLSEASSNNLISRAAHDALVNRLKTELLSRAEALNGRDAITSETLQEVNAVLRYGKLLKLDSSLLATLGSARAAYEESQKELAVAANAQAVIPSIAPAKLLSRAQPQYPQRALARGIEGWVEVNFNIDTQGRPSNVSVTASNPARTFDQAAIKAIENWQFLPAMNLQTGQAVSSETKTTRIHFKLEER